VTVNLVSLCGVADSSSTRPVPSMLENNSQLFGSCGNPPTYQPEQVFNAKEAGLRKLRVQLKANDRHIADLYCKRSCATQIPDLEFTHARLYVDKGSSLWKLPYA
jgi:hypothetical protein